MSLPPIAQQLLVVGVPLLLFLSYIGLSLWLRGSRYIFSGQADERAMLDRGEVTLQQLQTTSWQINTQKSIQFGSFSLATVVISVFLVIDKRIDQKLQPGDDFFYQLVAILGMASLAVIAYFAALQFWFLAVDAGGPVASRLAYRQLATVFQTAGWQTLLLTALLSVASIEPWLGLSLALVWLLASVGIFELKARRSLDDETAECHTNAFQDGIAAGELFRKNDGAALPERGERPTLRVMSWNVGRGYNPAALSAQLRSVGADVAALQEVDWGNERTGNADVLQRLADDTDSLGLFGVEFYEISTPYRPPRMAGGGVHGNALLTRLTPDRSFRIELPQYVDWDSPPGGRLGKVEKRKGGRFALCAEFKLGEARVVVASVHLEDKAGGMWGRIAQFEALLAGIDRECPEATSVVVAGDFNTFESGLTRFFRFRVGDGNAGRHRFRSECWWWRAHVLPRYGFEDPFRCKDWTFRYGLARHKLDWLAVRGGRVAASGVGPFASSDHRPIWAEVVPDIPDGQLNAPGQGAEVTA